ncbi:MAG: hypothetical protein MR298_10845 [Odoribacter sp.]|nr:hypothetical protein [Odoribacter sp.]
MKKVMYLVAFLMSAVWVFSSCSDDDDSTTKPGDESSTTAEQIIYSFVKETDALSGEVVVGIELKNMDGTNYIAKEAIHLAFVFAETSTAVLNTHFTVEDNVTEFVVPKGKRNATIKLKYVALEEGKDLIEMKINAAENFVAGNYDKIKIKIYGPTTVGKLFGKWVFKETTSFDDIKTNYEGATEPSDFVNMPVNNSNLDTLEFVSGDKDMLKLHVAGDMKNYFRDCDVVYLEDRTVQDPYNGERKTYSYIEFSKVNEKFSATTIEERKAEVAVRILEDGTLEVMVFDYAPVDFFQGILSVMETMEYTPIIYTFTKVEE